MTNAGDNDEFYVPGLMDLSAYSLERTEADSAWDSFVEKSPQGTLFVQSEFIQATGLSSSLWYCRKNAETMGAVALVESADGIDCIHSGLLVYSGVLFRPDDPKQNPAQIFSEQFRVTSSIIRDLAMRYRRVEMALHHSFADLRPFLWHNYGSDGPHFDISLRYTSLIDLRGVDADPVQENTAYLACNKSRRQDIRYAQKAGIETTEEYDRGLFENLYRRTFEAQGIMVPEPELGSILAATDRLNENGRLRMYRSQTPGDDVGSVALFGIDSKRAYYLYGANNPDLRSGYTGTAVLWDAFRDLARRGVEEADLEGINSPKRGYFKLSFGGTITPYYIARLGQQ
tara:strand:+ start:28069 stop:29097 length:1029 start_codon:yes stop_codon:yes gene_type:complete